MKKHRIRSVTIGTSVNKSLKEILKILKANNLKLTFQNVGYGPAFGLSDKSTTGG